RKAEFEAVDFGAVTIDRNRRAIEIDAEPGAVLTDGIDDEVVDPLVEHARGERAVAAQVMLHRSIEVPGDVRLQVGIAEYALDFVLIVLFDLEAGGEPRELRTHQTAIGRAAHDEVRPSFDSHIEAW